MVGDTNSVTVSAQLAHDNSAVGVRGNSSAVETETTTSVRSADRPTIKKSQQQQQQWGNSGTDWAQTSTSSMATFNRFAALASASADEDGEPFIIVDNKRSKRQHHNSPQLSQQSSSIMADNKSAKHQGTLLLGKASSQSASTKKIAAKRIRKNPFSVLTMFILIVLLMT